MDRPIADLAEIIARSLAKNPILLHSVNAWLRALSPAVARAGSHVGVEAAQQLLCMAHAPPAVQEAAATPEMTAVAEEAEVPEVLAVPM